MIRLQLYQRCIIAALFYLINAIVITLSWKNERLWQFYAEPIKLFGCFLMLGFITSDFLTPSLSQISRSILRISDRVSGFTLLAMGNAFPDITGTYQAMNAGAMTLAVGELLGGIFFLLTVVLGSMVLIKTIHLKPMDTLCCNQEESDTRSVSYNRQVFLQDVSIFGGLILLSIYFLYDGNLKLWECLLMVIAYCTYATFLVFDHKHDRLYPSNAVESPQYEHSNEMEDISTIVSNTACPEISPHGNNMNIFNEGIRDRRANIRRRIRRYLRVNYNRWIRLTLRDFLDIWENEALLKNQQIATADLIPDLESQAGREEDLISSPETIRRVSTWQEGSCHRNLSEVQLPLSEEEDAFNSSEREETDALLSVPPKRPSYYKSLSCEHIPDERPIYYSLTPVIQSDEQQHVIAVESQVRSSRSPRSWIREFKLSDYLTDANVFLPVSEFILLLFTTPVSIWLSILIPAMPHCRQDKPQRIFDVVRFSLSPAISFLLLIGTCPLPVLLACAFLFFILLFRWYKGIIDWNLNICAVAMFILSMSATSFNVHLVVDVLMKWGEKFNISHSLLGLTLFAWGNSLGDLVSNIVFMEIGVLDIALGACFGSSLLYFLFGIGIDGLMLMLGRHKGCSKITMNCGVSFQVDSHLSLSAVGVLSSLIILGIMVPFNNWCIDKKISLILLALYIFITGLNIYKEVSI